MTQKTKIEKLEERIKKLEQETPGYKPKNNSTDDTVNKYFSRRDFLKMFGMGAATITMSSAASAQFINLSNMAMASDGIPSGVITMWGGSISNIPDGWTLCDGSNGAPNLQDRFVVGAGNSYAVGGTGGQNEVQLTVDQMPSHQHPLYHSSDNSPNGSTSAVTVSNYNVSGPTTNPITATGGDQAHENRPPYYAVAYIMKI